MKSIFLSLGIINRTHPESEVQSFAGDLCTDKNRRFITTSEVVNDYIHSIISSYAHARIVSNYIYHLSIFARIHKKISNHNLNTILIKYKMFYVKHFIA